MLTIISKRVGKYIKLIAAHDAVRIDLGLYDPKEAIAFAQELESASESIRFWAERNVPAKEEE